MTIVKISEASHPAHRPMTVLAAIATWADSLQPGPNKAPEFVDDIRGTGVVPINRIRAMLAIHLGKGKVITRVTQDGLVAYLPNS